MTGPAGTLCEIPERLLLTREPFFLHRGSVQVNASPERGGAPEGRRGGILPCLRRIGTTQYPIDSTPQSAPQTAPLTGEPKGEGFRFLSKIFAFCKISFPISGIIPW